MSDVAEGGAPASPGGGGAEDRATTFQAVSGNQGEHYSGEVLLVSAYALVWALLLAWVGFVWRRQRALDTRLSELEKILDARATAAGARPASGGRP